MVDRVHVEVAWETDPLTRPAALDWTRLGTVDPKIKIESLTTSRGVNIRTGQIEAGEATAKISDLNGNLDPSNALAEWAPNVLPRRRVRFIVDPAAPKPALLSWLSEVLEWDGELLVWAGEDVGETVLWTGFIRSLPIQWRRELQWTTLTAAGLTWLLSEQSLPPSVLHGETLAAAPDAYWSFAESAGLVVEDLVGLRDGRLSGEISSMDLVPYAAGGMTLSSATMTATGVTTANEDFTVSLWFQTSDPVTLWEHSNAAGTIWVRIGVTSSGITLTASDGSVDGPETAPVSGLLDNRTHHVVVNTTVVTSVLFGCNIWVDGVLVATEGSGGFIGTLLSVDGQAVTDALNVVTVGDETATVTVGQVAWWDTSYPAAVDLYTAGMDAWAGDLTGARLNRILDLAGVDPDDRDIDAGTQTCGPTLLDGANVMEYVTKIAATEGAPVYEDAEGRICLRNRIGNAPASVATFSDDPGGDSGWAVAPLDPDFSLDRLINVARVTRENGVTQEVTAAASVNTYGPKTVSLDTLHQSPAGSRSIAARLTIRNSDPRLVFPSVVADVIDTTASVMTGTDIAEAVVVIARPPRGGDPIEQTSIVERVEQTLEAGASWRTTFGVAEHTVLPDFWWDEPGQGWDESVWVAP